MTSQDLLAYQDTIANATKDIHRSCAGVEISILWDDGKMRMVTGSHKAKLWNALGSAEFHITHDQLLERGDAYQGFLATIAATALKKLKV